MNGVEFLLDTCFIIRWRAQDSKVFAMLEQLGVQDGQCAYSDVSYVEVFGWRGMTAQEAEYFEDLLTGIPRLPITDAILDRTIALRRQHTIKLPDALIAATAQVHGLRLLTLDDRLGRMIPQPK